jgi:cytochrome c6
MHGHPHTEVHAAVRRITAALAVLALDYAVFTLEAGAADFFNGKQLYASYCEGCHGASGQGEMPGTPNFTRGKTLMRPDLQLYVQIRDGKNAMPGFQGVLDESEILDVISYLRSFY